ncbi:MAG TPA: S-layer homology domain-containing protein, partial [Clostridiaceae bacterium]|nr:S-layer homology domain-containing protein [Clostridiaceae bacterium]HHW32342.1 S-layer homology domain-containing protein [Clostridiaceae bacterium]
EAVSKMQKAGIISGKPNNIFDPKGSATRAEASKMIAVLLQIIR